MEKDIEKDVFNKMFLFYGEEKYLRNLQVNRIKKQFGELVKGVNYILLDDKSISNLISEINTPAFGFENKLILINNSKLFKINRKKAKDEETDQNSNDEEIEEPSNKYEEEIINYLDKQDLINVTIIFNEDDVAKNKKMYKLLDRKGIVKEFKPLKPKEVADYAVDLCNKYNVKLDKTNAVYFSTICSTNMEDVINELRKLIEYTGSGNEIKKEFIDIITTKTLDAIIFDLTDNLGKRKIKESIDTLDELLMQKEPIQKIYIMIYRHYKNLYLIKTAQNEGIENINEELKLHPFVFMKAKDQVKNYTSEELTKIYKQLMQIDIEYKSGNINLYDALINVMCNII